MWNVYLETVYFGERISGLWLTCTHSHLLCWPRVAKLYQHHIWLSLTRGNKCQPFALKIVMISYERLHVGLQVLSAENFCLGINFMEKWSLTLVKKISSSRRVRESSRHCCAPPGEGSMGCPTPQQGIGAAQGKAPRSKTDLKFSRLCHSTCWVHSFVYNNNVYYFTIGFLYSSNRLFL